MSFDPDFLDAVGDLYAPVQGTERIAELLYLLIRMVRPRSVLEAGMGYTSPFIAKALRDNVASWQREHQDLAAKTAKYVAEIDALPRRDTPAGPNRVQGLAAVYAAKSTALAKRRTDWMFQDPPLLRPGYYLDPYRPRAYCIDDFSNPTSTASQVIGKLAKLGLRDFVGTHTGDFWAFDFAALPPEARPVDMVWIDLPLNVMNAISVIEGKHWELLNPDGGLLLIHCMLTNAGGQALVQEFERIRQRTRPPAFEMLGLIEPHKVVQNNVLLIRKVSGAKPEQIEDLFTAPQESEFEHHARRLVKSD
jgi:hypothetical protein